MNEYRVKWWQYPRVQHHARILYIEAASEDNARKLARDHVERRYGIEWFGIEEVAPAQPVPEGRVKGEG